MTREGRRPRASRRNLAVLLFVVLLLPGLALPGAAAQDGPPTRVTDHPLLQPIDAQDWVDMADLTWDDYTPIRPEDWNSAETSQGSENQYRTAIILMDFPDQPFLVSQEPEAHPFGNPQPGWDPVAPEDVSQWMYEYYAVPNEYNGGQTLHAYWMETSHGRIGVDVDVFGPYTMPGKLHEYGIPDGSFNAPVNTYCPQGDTCGRNIRTDGGSAWRQSIGCSTTNCGYNNLFYVTAGHDESSTWQEFGEMLFQTRDDVPDAFGPPRNPDGSPPRNNAGNIMTNWANTRYVPWTSWRAAANHWPNASGSSSTQAESSGQSVFAHEFSHLRGLPDNYNNPFADNIRNYSGYWEMMSRGTFNGPGGTHNRWQVPNQGGSGLGPHHTVRHKRHLGVFSAGDLLQLQRNTLADQGVAVARVQQRSAQPGQGGYLGINLTFGAGGNLRTCAALGFTGANSFWCHGNNAYTDYTVEVVDRVGNDSFTPGHGVLISLSRFPSNTQPNVWIIDPKPEDIGMIDFYRPDGTPVPVVRGDPRQLNDATFHAGTNSGSAYEFHDDLNDLQFYILDTHRDEDGILFYDIGVRRTIGGDPFERGVGLGNASKTAQAPGFLATCSFPLTNTGEAGSGAFDSDVYRVSATSSSSDWEAVLPNALAAVKAGDTVEVPVHALRLAVDEDGAARTTITLTATSETDPSQSASRTCNVHVRDTTSAPSQG